LTWPINAPIIIIKTNSMLEKERLGTENWRFVDDDDCIAMLLDALAVVERGLGVLEEGGARGEAVLLEGLAGGDPGWLSIWE
jgi:hypothetical protein